MQSEKCQKKKKTTYKRIKHTTDDNSATEQIKKQVSTKKKISAISLYRVYSTMDKNGFLVFLQSGTLVLQKSFELIAASRELLYSARSS